jgi:D-inositol-3-phosphate glycosyltransferase
MKRIAMISYHTCPLASEEGEETGGMNMYVLQLAKALTRQGIIIDIFTRSQDARQPSIISVSPNLRVIHCQAGAEEVILPNTAENKQRLLDALPVFVEAIKTVQTKEQISYDLFDCHYYLSGLVGLQLSKEQNKPLLMTFHTLALMKSLISPEALSKEDTERVQAELLLTRKAQAIISPSEKESMYLRALYDVAKEKIYCIPPGVDTTLFKPQNTRQARKAIHAEQNHKLILFVGRIDAIKGLDVLLYAMKIMHYQHPQLNACLWIVGGDPKRSAELEKLNQLRKILHLTTTVRFVSRKRYETLPNYYNAADLVVMPSHYESFGMTALEAMSCGVPIITTNVTGISTLIDERCQRHITTVNNPLLLAEQMAELLLNHPERHIWKERDAFDWKYVAKKIKDIYMRLS